MSKPKIVAGCGAINSYTHIAYKKHIDAENHTYRDFRSFSNAVSALESNLADVLIIPVYNTTIGDVAPALNALKGHTFSLNGEVISPINHALIAHTSTSIENIKKVLSYRVALDQCIQRINRHGWDQLEYRDTAAAIAHVLTYKYKDIAAIGPIEAAEGFDSNILIHPFNDKPNNATTFRIYTR